MFWIISHKKKLFILVLILAIISTFILLLNIKNNVRKFNQNLLVSVQALYSQHLESLNNNIESNKFILPFKLSYTINKTLEFSEPENILYVNENKKEELNKIIDKFIVFEKNLSSSSNVSYPIVNIKTKIWKHLNIYFLIHPEEDFLQYKKYSNVIKKLNYLDNDYGYNIYIKTLVYDKFKGVINSDDFYKDLKNYNSRLTFEELNDEASLNILLLNDKNTETIDSYFNKDINSNIYTLSFEENFTNETLMKIININQLDNSIKQLISDSEVLSVILKLNNSKQVQFSRLLIESILNLEKLNKIFSLYDSIRTIENVKEKFNSIQNSLITIVKNKFNINDIELMAKVYIDVNYLMDSNELVSYEHYFSNEFKIGMFLPPMLPILYGLFKAIKALTI